MDPVKPHGPFEPANVLNVIKNGGAEQRGGSEAAAFSFSRARCINDELPTPARGSHHTCAELRRKKKPHECFIKCPQQNKRNAIPSSVED